MTHPWIIDNDCVKYYPDPTLQLGVMAQTRTFGICTVTLTLEIWPCVKFMTYLWVIDNNCVTYYPAPTRQWRVITRTRILGMCAMWPWHLRYVQPRSWHTLGSWTTNAGMSNIQIQDCCEKLWPGHGFWVCVHCDLDLTLEIWPWVKLMTHPWFMENNCVKYYPDPTLQLGVMVQTWISGYVCTVTLTLEIWPWVKVMTHPWFMGNNCLKYYPDPTLAARSYGLGTDFWVCVHCDLDLEDVTLGQGHETSLGHWQQLY